MDDDIILKAKNGGNPWRQFERFLVNIEPAVAAVETNNGTEAMNKLMKNRYLCRQKSIILSNLTSMQNC